MSLTATRLGDELGMTAQEMNQYLVKTGFLEGDPGNYFLTELGQTYGNQTFCHRGCGGDPKYNRYWTLTSFDDSIRDVLPISEDLIKDVKTELAAKRAARYAEMKAARKAADQQFLKQLEEKKLAEQARQMAEAKAKSDAEKLVSYLHTAKIVTLGVGAAVLVCYCVHKLKPRVTQWWQQHKQNKDAKRHQAQQGNLDAPAAE